MQVAAIVPAFNEEQRIGTVLEVLQAVPELHEIIVVDDGSTDNTFDAVPQTDRIRAIKLDQNGGKGAALRAGALATQADILVFIDADLLELHPEHVTALLSPVINQEAEMSVAVFSGGRWRTDMAQRIAPNISGQRALYKSFFLSLSGIEQTRYGLETALTTEAKLHKLRVQQVPWQKVTHVLKEEKLGFMHGSWERARMYWQIGAYVWNSGWHKHRFGSVVSRVRKRKIGEAFDE